MREDFQIKVDERETFLFRSGLLELRKTHKTEELFEREPSWLRLISRLLMPTGIRINPRRKYMRLTEYTNVEFKEFLDNGNGTMTVIGHGDAVKHKLRRLKR